MGDTLTADTILSISAPERLFTPSADETKKRYRDLARVWHPDVCRDPRARDVFEHLAKLHSQALEKQKGATWGYSGRATFGHGSERLSFPYLRLSRLDIGDVYLTSNEVVYNLPSDYANRFLAVGKDFTFGSPKMEADIARSLPIEVEKFGPYVLRVQKRKELLALRDVLNHFGGALPPRHVAWILNTLFNLTCYLQYAGLTHNDISPDTYFIDPADHSGALLGGWWFAVKEGEPLVQVPARTFRVLPARVRAEKTANSTTDAELVLATGRELLGDIDGRKLSADTPEPMRKWLNSAGGPDAITNYANWTKVLERSFGPRKFVELKLNESMLYP